MAETCFNSTLVQLKDAVKEIMPQEKRRFNSTLVQLKVV